MCPLSEQNQGRLKESGHWKRFTSKARFVLTLSTGRTVFMQLCCTMQNTFGQRSKGNWVIARAKRGRVVENEYEKANRRPDRPGHPRSEEET